ncbi:MAG: NHL repeat-containing protein [Pseudomonadota bacterium]
MKRRNFIKYIGIAGAASFLEVSPRSRDASAGAEDCGSVPVQAPYDLAFDAAGNMYITDSPAYTAARCNRASSTIDTFGGPGAEPGKFNFPRGICTDSAGRVYVADSNNCRVQVFDDKLKPVKVIGAVGSVGGTFATPQGLSFDTKFGLSVADTRNHRVQIFKDFGLKAIVGELGDEPDRFRLPTSVAASPEGELFVLDSKHGMVKVFDKDLKYKRSFGSNGAAPGMLNLPEGMDFDRDGRLWIADTRNNRIQVFGLDGRLISVVDAAGAGEERFDNPTGVACRDDKVYVADYGNAKIRTLSGKV